jgi:hypothetical protein
MKKIILVIVLGHGFVLSSAQTTDPSTWPAPTIELVNSGFYSKEKLMKYWEWKDSTLPDIFLMVDNQRIQHTELKWERVNFQHRFSFKDLGVEFIVDHQPKKNRIMSIRDVEQSYLDTLDVKNYDWLHTFFNSNSDRLDRHCHIIEALYGDVFILVKDPKKQTIKMFKTSYCVCPCEDDESIKSIFK